MNNEIHENYTYINPFEKKRKLMRNLLLLRILVIIAPIPIFVVNLILFIVRLASKKFFNIYNLIFFTTAPLLAILIIIIITVCVSKMKVSWRKNFKQTIVLDRFSKMFINTKYTYDQGFSRDTIHSSGLVRDGNTYFSEDFLCANYKGVKFESSDVKIKQITPVKGLFSKILPAKKVTYFSGQWMIFDFNKKIDAYVRIIEKTLLIKRHFIF